MNPTVQKELLALGILIVFTFVFYMVPSMEVYIASFVAVVSMFLIYLISILGKTDRDEREESHRAMASEAGFAVGGVLVLGAIAHQVFVMKAVDAWLFVILLGMLSVRLLVRIVLEKKH